MSQKVKGLNALQLAALPGLEYCSYVVCDRPEDLPAAWRHMSTNCGEIFARPAPSRPRHGFVESVRVKGYEESAVSDLFAAALQQDSGSKLILSRYINANLSAICCNRSISISAGHDGATAGRVSKVFDAPDFSGLEWLAESAGITNEPYYELVADSHHITYAVQLRDGPRISQMGGNFVPADTEILSVVQPTADLLEWESVCAKLAPGTVVWIPGASLASHAAVHAVLCNIPVVTDNERPQVGTTLHKTAITEQRGNFAGGVYDAILLCKMSTRPEMARLMMGIVHGIGSLRHLSMFEFYCGLAAGLAYYLYGDALYSESVHGAGSADWQNPRPEIHPSSVAWVSAVKKMNECWFAEGMPRSFGGNPWYNAYQSYCDLHNAISRADVTEAGKALNRIVHASHNNGSIVDRFLGADDMHALSVAPVIGFMSSISLLYGVEIKSGSISGEIPEIERPADEVLDCGNHTGELRWPTTRKPCETFTTTVAMALGTKRPKLRRGPNSVSFDASPDISFDIIGFD